MSDKIDRMLGLCMRAGKMKSGMFLTEDSVKSREAKLVVIAEDAKKNTVKTLRNKCTSYNVELRFYGTTDGLGRCIGKERRSCLAIIDEGFATSILGMIDEDVGSKKRGLDGENENQ